MSDFLQYDSYEFQIRFSQLDAIINMYDKKYF